MIKDALCLLLGLMLPASAFGAISATSVSAVGIVYAFGGPNKAKSNVFDAESPASGLVKGQGGDFYGMTHSGGAHGFGAVFKVTPGGAETVLHSFVAGSSAGVPFLALGHDGDLYGLIQRIWNGGAGAFFKVTPTGAFTVVRKFTRLLPASGLSEDRDGNFYGLAEINPYSPQYVVFRITPTGTSTVLHKFGGMTPAGCPIEGRDGNLYGLTSDGGAHDLGSVYRLTLGGVFTVLHSFADGVDGAEPVGRLIQASDGNFYGMTAGGGQRGDAPVTQRGAGTVFKITSTGAESILHSFGSKAEDPPIPGPPTRVQPGVALVQGRDGGLFGITSSGGAQHDGMLFEVTTSGVLTILHSFGTNNVAADAIGVPQGSLVQGDDGDFYGVASDSGDQYGVVFKTLNSAEVEKMAKAAEAAKMKKKATARKADLKLVPNF